MIDLNKFSWTFHFIIQVYWTQQFLHIKVQVKDESNQDNTTLSHISLTFCVILCCLLFTTATLFIEIFIFFFKLRKVGKNHSLKV